MFRLILVMVSALTGLVVIWPASAATIAVGGNCGIVEAIRAANTNTPQGGCPAGDPNSSVRDTVELQSGVRTTLGSPP